MQMESELPVAFELGLKVVSKKITVFLALLTRVSLSLMINRDMNEKISNKYIVN